MSLRKTMIRPVLITGFLILFTGVLWNTALGISPGWPGTPAVAATPPYPAKPAASPTYMRVTTIEAPYLQYRDGSMLAGTGSPYGPYTCVVALYLNYFSDPTQFQILRTFQPRFPNNVYGAPQPVSSPGVGAQANGPTQLASGVTELIVYPHPENPYGRETLAFYSTDAFGNLKTLFDSQQILVYPHSTAKIFNDLAFAANPATTPNPNPTPVTLGSVSPYPSAAPYSLPYPSPIPNFSGDQVRLRIEISNAYPGGDTWVVIYPGNPPAYPGNPSPNLPSSAKEIPGSRITAPVTDLIPLRVVFFEVGTAKDTSGVLLVPTPGTYTVQVLQNRSPYPLESLAGATFTVNSSAFNVNSQLGKTAP
jgi:hypothetical protein